MSVASCCSLLIVAMGIAHRLKVISRPPAPRPNPISSPSASLKDQLVKTPASTVSYLLRAGQRRPLPLYLRNGDHQRFCSENNFFNVNMVDPSLNSSSCGGRKSNSCPDVAVVLKQEEDRKQQQQLPRILSLDEIPISVETII